MLTFSEGMLIQVVHLPNQIAVNLAVFFQQLITAQCSTAGWRQATPEDRVSPLDERASLYFFFHFVALMFCWHRKWAESHLSFKALHSVSWSRRHLSFVVHAFVLRILLVYLFLQPPWLLQNEVFSIGGRCEHAQLKLWGFARVDKKSWARQQLSP